MRPGVAGEKPGREGDAEETTMASTTWVGVTSKAVIPATSDSIPNCGGRTSANFLAARNK